MISSAIDPALFAKWHAAGPRQLCLQLLVLQKKKKKKKTL
jgi:hypothetical protein